MRRGRRTLRWSVTALAVAAWCGLVWAGWQWIPVPPRYVFPGGFRPVAISEDGRTCIAVNAWNEPPGASFQVWDLETGSARPFAPDLGPFRRCESVDPLYGISRDGRVAGVVVRVSQSSMPPQADVLVRDLSTGTTLTEFTTMYPLGGLAPDSRSLCFRMTPDGSLAVSCWLSHPRDGSASRVLHWWDLGRQQPHPGFHEVDWPVAFSPDGKTFAAAVPGSTDIKLCEVATGKELGRLSGNATRPECVAFSSDGRRLASAHSAPRIILWDVLEQKELASVSTTRGYVYLQFVGGDSVLAGEDSSGWSAVLDVTTLPPTRLPMFRTAVSPDGSLLAQEAMRPMLGVGEVDRHLQILERASGRVRAMIAVPQTSVRPLCFSPDNRWLAAVAVHRFSPQSMSDDEIWLVDVATGRRRGTIPIPFGDVDCEFTRDGQSLLVTTGSNPYQPWRLAGDVGFQAALWDVPPHKPAWSAAVCGIALAIPFVVIGWRWLAPRNKFRRITDTVSRSTN